MCNDPTRELITVLFTNRCYPVKTGQFDTIHTLRQAFNNAVIQVTAKAKAAQKL